MVELTKIEWATGTFNGWIGCEHQGPECDHCYAEVDTFAGTSGAGYEAAAMCSPLLPNVWLGTTAGTQKTAKRISHLLECRPFVAKLFVSVEPMLEPMTLRAVPSHRGGVVDALTPTLLPLADTVDGVDGVVSSLDWVICGGESGHKARTFDLAWARAVRDECAATRVPFFFKQTGAKPQTTSTTAPSSALVTIGGSRAHVSIGSMTVTRTHPIRSKKGGDLAEIPEDLRIRQFPARNNGSK